MVAAARLSLSQLGVRKPVAEETTLSLTTPCRMPLNADHVATRYWSYRGAKVDVVSHSVFGFDPQRGADVVGQVRAALATCQTWIYGDAFLMRMPRRVHGEPARGVDNVLAYCHHGTIISGSDKGDKVYLCDGLMSRGSLVRRRSQCWPMPKGS